MRVGGTVLRDGFLLWFPPGLGDAWIKTGRWGGALDCSSRGQPGVGRGPAIATLLESWFSVGPLCSLTIRLSGIGLALVAGTEGEARGALWLGRFPPRQIRQNRAQGKAADFPAPRHPRLQRGPFCRLTVSLCLETEGIWRCIFPSSSFSLFQVHLDQGDPPLLRHN